MVQSIYGYFKDKEVDNKDHISAWKSKGFSDEHIKPPATSDDSLVPSLNYIGVRTRVRFYGQCLKKDKFTFTNNI